MKIKIRYPYTVINQIEIEIDESKLPEQYRDLTSLRNQVELINSHVPGYEQADISLCKGARECDMYTFEILDEETSKQIDKDDLKDWQRNSVDQPHPTR